MDRYWLPALAASAVAVLAFYAGAYLLMGRGGMPLGYDTYVTWQPLTKDVLSIGPLAFVLQQRFVEVLYPLLASVPASLGVPIATTEIVFPIVLSVGALAGLALLAREFSDPNAAVLSVAFAAGWFAIYRMGADFRGQLLAFVFLLFATTLLLRLRRTVHPFRDVSLFAILVALAALAHVETTAAFVSIWGVTALMFYLRSGVRRRTLLAALAVALTLAVPIVPYAIEKYPLIFDCGANCRPYPVLPVYWMEVFGPEIALALLGIAVCFDLALRGKADPLTKMVLTWTAFCLVVGALAYIFPTFNLEYSDRVLLMLPVPLLSAVSTTWLAQRSSTFARHPRLIPLLVLLIPAIAAPGVFAYLVPQRFVYYPPYFP